MAHKRIDYTQLGGFPLTQDALDFMQQAYQEAIAALASLVGDGVIVSGMTDNGSTVTDGWIIWNGELLPFQGGNKQTYFIIQDITGTEQFEDDSIKPVYFTRLARFGSGSGQIPFSALTRLDRIASLQTNLTTLNNLLTSLSNSLSSHLANTSNPHQVTKDQVGLGNLPNAKSDSTSLNDSNTLATSAAVYNAVLQSKKIIYSGSYYVGDVAGSDDKRTVYHNQNISGSYMVIGCLRSVGVDWNSDNDVFAMVRQLTANSFDLLLREVSSDVQNLYFDYIIIKN